MSERPPSVGSPIGAPPVGAEPLQAGAPPLDGAGNGGRCYGREVELARIAERLAAVGGDRGGHVVHVAGPAGIGKRRLVDEVKRRARADGFAVVEAHARESTRASALLAEIGRGLLRSLGEAAEHDATDRGGRPHESRDRDAHESRDRDLRARGAGLLAALEPAPVLGAGSPSAADRKLSLFEQCAALIAAVSRRVPLLLIVHEVDRADAATRELLAHVVETRFAGSPSGGCDDGDRAAALLLLTSREPPARSVAAASTTCITLAPLDEAAVRQFLGAPDVVRLVAAATGGVPAALEALLASVALDEASLRAARLSRLSPAARLAAETLSVLDRPISPERLRDVLACSVAGDPLEPGTSLGGDAATTDALVAVRAAIAELARAALVETIVEAGEARVSLLSSADAMAIRSAIAPDRRAALERSVALALRAQPGACERVAAAEHLLRAGAGVEAAEALFEAATLLEAGFAYDRAAALYREARARATREPLAVAIDERLLETARLTGDYGAALAEAERLAVREPDRAVRHRAVGQIHLLRDDYRRAGAALARAREIALRTGDDLELARTIAAIAEACLLDGRHEDAIAECAVGLRVTAPDPRSPSDGAVREAEHHRLEIRNTLGKAHLAQARYDVAAGLFEENLDEARRASDAFEEARALINVGICRLRLGDTDAAAERYRAALRVAEAADDHRHRAFCLQNLGVLAHWRCEYGAAIRYFSDAMGAFRKLSQRARVAWVALDLASLYLDLSVVDRAAQLADLADRALEPGATAQARYKRAIIAGRLARFTGDRPAARQHLAEARREAGEGSLEIHAEATLAMAGVELDAGHFDEALALTTELLPRLSALSPATQGRARLLEAEIAIAAGVPLGPTLRRGLLAAIETFLRVGDLDGESRAQIALARVAHARGDLADVTRRQRRASLLEARLRERVPEELVETFAADPTRRAIAHALVELDAPPGDGARRPRPASPATSAPVIVEATPAPPTPHAAVPDRFQRLIGKTPPMRRVYEVIEKIARHDSVVLIRGESGTGKELVAEAIHARSGRREQPLVKVNCGALVETLLLSELFGHERGAFTGAVQRKKGRFEAAHGGTIFLDEIGDISPRTQNALLRVIQERELERVGSNTPIKIDVRILCATNRDLEAMVARGEFREDLYYRLKGIEVALPPLRDRPDDVVLIAQDLLSRIADERGGPRMELAVDAIDVLRRYRWPGNVRELENAIRSVSVLADGPRIGARELAACPALFRVEAAARPSTDALRPAAAVATPIEGDAASAWERMGAEGIGLRELQQRIEIECIRRALGESRGNITRAAELLKMKRPRLSQLIKEYGISL